MGAEQGIFFFKPYMDVLFKIIQIGSEFLANGAMTAIKFTNGEFSALPFYW